MKRTLLYILLTTLIATPLLFGMSVQNVHAQVTPPPVRNQAQAVGRATQSSAPTELTCVTIKGVLPHFNIGMCAAWIMNGIRQFVGWFTEKAGMLLNIVVQELVFRMGAMTGMLAGVTIAWSVMRDIANVILVFLLIFVGIAIIIRATSYNSKQLVWRIVIAALLVNFSLYFAKIVIDVTNIFAGQTYIMILKEGGVPDAEKCATSEITAATYDSPCFNIGISGAFMHVLKINSIYKNAKAETTDQAENMGWNVFYIEIFGTAILGVLCFIFLAAAVLFVTRFVTLVYLMIVSPIAFVGLVTGKFDFGKTWWTQLLNNSLFAPVFFLLLWVSMVVIKRMADLYWPTCPVAAAANCDASYSALALESTSGYTILLLFFVSAGLLIASIVAAKRLGVAGSSAATGFAGGVMFGGAAWMYRNTGGRYGNRWANDEGLRNRAAGYKTDQYGKRLYNYDKDGNKVGDGIKETSRYKTFAAKQQLKTAQRMGGASGDVRNSERLGKLTAGILGKNKLDVGKGGGKGGYMGIRKKYVEENVKFAEGLGVDKKRQAELEERKSGSVKVVTDPVTGQQTVVRTKGLDQLTSEKKTEAQGAQKRYQEDVRELQKARRDLRAGRGSQAEVDRLELRVARRETVARGRSAQLNAMENEGVILQDEMLKTNRAYAYADTIERNAGQYGFMAPDGIVIAHKGEATEAANAIRTKFKTQQKYRGMTEIFKEMEAAGVIAPGTTPPGGAAAGGGGGGTSDGGSGSSGGGTSGGGNNTGGGGGTRGGSTGTGGGGGAGPTAQPLRRSPRGTGPASSASTAQPSSSPSSAPISQPPTSATPQSRPVILRGDGNASTPATLPIQSTPVSKAGPQAQPVAAPSEAPQPKQFKAEEVFNATPAPRTTTPAYGVGQGTIPEIQRGYKQFLGDHERERREARVATPPTIPLAPVRTHQNTRSAQQQQTQTATTPLTPAQQMVKDMFDPKKQEEEVNAARRRAAEAPPRYSDHLVSVVTADPKNAPFARSLLSARTPDEFRAAIIAGADENGLIMTKNGPLPAEFIANRYHRKATRKEHGQTFTSGNETIDRILGAEETPVSIRAGWRSSDT